MQARQSSDIKIIDVSHHQGSINWSKVKADGVAGAFIKATEGKTLVDLKFSSYSLGAVQAGLKVGYYHYAHPENNFPEDEAANFYRSVKGHIADFPYVLDVEGESAALGAVKLTAWCVKWLQEVERLTGHPAMVYTGASFARSYLGKALSKWPLWVAHYGADKPMGNETWSEWAVFQYASNGSVPGVGSGNVDMNVMEADFWNKHINPADPAGVDNIKIVVNDKLAAYGRIIDGHVYLPLRQLGEALGKAVHWDNVTKLPYVDGKAVETFSLIDGQTFVGVRDAAESLGAKVSWDEAMKKVYIYE